MKILLLGKNGQVGWELQRALAPLGKVVALGRSIDEAGLCGDLAALDGLAETVRRIAPNVIVNAAAYTAVDKAESEKQTADLINHQASAVLAREALELDAWLVHYSTDYVFDGSDPSPRGEDDATGPLNVYGASKLAGEQAIAAAGIDHLIFRTSWVYGMRGKNFLLTMMRLAKEREELKVVADQHGAPTWSRTIADTTALVLAQAQAQTQAGADWWRQNSGVYHLSAQGQTTWFEFTQAIVEAAGLSCRVLPIGSADYPTPARRPQYSVMSSERLVSRFCHLPDWKQALHLCMG